MNERVIFPFTAVVGQERMLRSLILNAVDPRIGGVLIRGERGTAKSTAARALAALLPPMKVVKDCRFGCDPAKPTTWCTECRERFVGGEDPLPVETKETPFINLPVSATEDRVVGTLDIERAIQKGERHFEPGVLAAANRGLPYIDEVGAGNADQDHRNQECTLHVLPLLPGRLIHVKHPTEECTHLVKKGLFLVYRIQHGSPQRRTRLGANNILRQRA